MRFSPARSAAPTVLLVLARTMADAQTPPAPPALPRISQDVFITATVSELDGAPPRTTAVMTREDLRTIRRLLHHRRSASDSRHRPARARPARHPDRHLHPGRDVRPEPGARGRVPTQRQPERPSQRRNPRAGQRHRSDRSRLRRRVRRPRRRRPRRHDQRDHPARHVRDGERIRRSARTGHGRGRTLRTCPAAELDRCRLGKPQQRVHVRPRLLAGWRARTRRRDAGLDDRCPAPASRIRSQRFLRRVALQRMDRPHARRRHVEAHGRLVGRHDQRRGPQPPRPFPLGHRAAWFRGESAPDGCGRAERDADPRARQRPAGHGRSFRRRRPRHVVEPGRSHVLACRCVRRAAHAGGLSCDHACRPSRRSSTPRSGAA